MIVNKITTGFVTQQFDTETRKFISQSFTAADSSDFEDEAGNDADEFSEYLNFDMVQPKQEKVPVSDMIIPAEVHDDDRRFEISFDALPWFLQASDQEILDLAAIDWGGEMESDEVAIFMAERDDEIEDMFKYMNRGFECHVDAEAARRWIKRSNPELYNQLPINGDEMA